MDAIAIAAPKGAATDDALVAEAQADIARFAAIYERYQVPVYRYLRALGAGEDDALDLAASTFERALRALPRYRRRAGALGAWLFRIARNARIDEHRRASRLTSSDGITPSASQAVDIRAIEVRSLVAQLPRPTRDAIALRYAAGLTSREIGVVIGKRPEAVQKLIERGLDTLRETLR